MGYFSEKKDEDICLFDNVPVVFSDAPTINEGLLYARNFVQEIFGFLHMPSVLVDVYGYKENDINGVAYKENDRYIIAISSGAFIRIHQWFETWCTSPELQKILNYAPEEKRQCIANLYKWCIKYMIAHELFHVLNGHCDIPANKEHFISDTPIVAKQELNIFEQILEFDADRAATRTCLYEIIKNSIDSKATIEQFEKETVLFSFAIYNLFMIFNGSSHANFDEYMNHGVFNKRHPHDGVRFSYSVAFITQALVNLFSNQTVVRSFLLKITDSCILFEKKVVGSETLKHCLFSPSYTYKGAQHIMNLNNHWEDVSKLLEPYALIALAETEYLDALPVFVSDSGDFL